MKSDTFVFVSTFLLSMTFQSLFAWVVSIMSFLVMLHTLRAKIRQAGSIKQFFNELFKK
jgi:hypothetical protein